MVAQCISNTTRVCPKAKEKHFFLLRVTGYVLNASATNEFGADGLSELQLIATQLAFDHILGLPQSIFRVTSVGSSQLTTLCGGNNAGALSIGSGTAVQVGVTNCSNINQTQGE